MFRPFLHCLVIVKYPVFLVPVKNYISFEFKFNYVLCLGYKNLTMHLIILISLE